MAGSCRREAKVDSSRGKGYCRESRAPRPWLPQVREEPAAAHREIRRGSLHSGFGTVESIVAGPALSGRVPRSQWHVRTVSSEGVSL